MTVQPIRPPALAGCVATARASLTSAAAIPVSVLTVDELTDGIGAVAHLESQVAALKLSLLAEADSRRLAKNLGATGTEAWAAGLTRSTRASMAQSVWLANLLEKKYAATREALAAGDVVEAQARVIVAAAEKLPADITDEQRRTAEAALVAKAVAGMNARRLRQAARRMLAVVSEELADRHEADQLEAEEHRAERETSLTLFDNGDGT